MSIPDAKNAGYWALVWGQFRKNKLAVFSAVVIFGLLLLAAWAPILANGKPFSWTEEISGENGQSVLKTTYPLWSYMTAPTRGRSVDYLFNYLFFLSIVALPIGLVFWKWDFGWASRKRILVGFGSAGFLALIPFIAPGSYERSATPSERKAEPGITTITVNHFFRRWKMDARYYNVDAASLDSSKGEGARFPLIPHDPSIPTEKTLQKPDAIHLLGTDREGRDLLARIIHGARISMSVGFVSVGIATLIGILFGGLAGYYRGWVDIVISRVLEIVMCFPTFFLIIAIIAFIEDRSIFHIMLVIGFTSWPYPARLVRGEFLKLADREFVQAAKALGCSGGRIMFTHMLPNALGPVLVSVAFGVAGAILTESALSYLGFGAPPPTPTWGELISQGKLHIDEAWWLLTYPGIAIFLTITVYNLAGDGLRDAMDPRLRQ